MSETLNVNRIKGAMAEFGDTQETLSEYLKINRVTLVNKLGRKSEFSIPELEKIARKYNKPISYFFEK